MFVHAPLVRSGVTNSHRDFSVASLDTALHIER